MRLKIQNFDVHVESMEAMWMYRGVIDGPWKLIAQNKLQRLQMKYPDYAVIREPDWEHLPGNLIGHFYDEKSYNGCPFPKGYWVIVQLVSYMPVLEKYGDEFTEFNCILFLEEFTTERLTEELQKIQWAEVCKVHYAD
jgi:hypothetical protein